MLHRVEGVSPLWLVVGLEFEQADLFRFARDLVPRDLKRIRQVQQWHFPDALYVLDFWHLDRRFQQVFGDEAVPIAICVGCARVGDVRGYHRDTWLGWVEHP